MAELWPSHNRLLSICSANLFPKMETGFVLYGEEGMFSRITIALTEDERVALQTVAQREMRGLREQIRYMLRKELSEAGLLPREQPQNEERCEPAPAHQ